MLKYFEILRDCNQLANIIGTYAESSAVSKTEGKYMGEKEHLLQAEIYLRQCIANLEDAQRHSIKSLKK